MTLASALFIFASAIAAQLNPESSVPTQPRTEQPKTEQPKTEQPKTEQPKTEEPPPALHIDANTSPKRALPDYDGRGPDPTTAGDILIWPPRLVLAPIWVVTDYVIRKPLGALISKAERDQWPAKAIDFFTFNDAHTIGIFPTALVDFGFRPSIGAVFFWEGLGSPRNDLQIRASTGGPNWYAASLADRITLGDNAVLSAEFWWVTRPDYIFAGTGPLSRQSRISRYGFDKLETGPRLDVRLTDWGRLSIRTVFKNERLRDGHFGGDPSLSAAVARGWYGAPSGFPRGEETIYEELTLVLDSRGSNPTNYSGVRFYGYGREVNDWRENPHRSWVRYGGDIGFYWDIFGHHRILGLELAAQFADPLQSGREIPFFEQVVWGGPTTLEGFRPGRLVGRSAAAATLLYEWPIWVWLNGTLQASLGNAFDAHLADFGWRLLRASGAVGVASSGPPDKRFEMTFGIGTEAFAAGGQITSFRFTIGSTNGF